MADEQKKYLFTPDEVQQASQENAVSNTNKAGITPIDLSVGNQSSAWRDIDQNQSTKKYYNAIKGSQPGSYQSQYSQSIKDTLNGLLNRKEFSYDVNADGLYQQIKDNYIKNAKQANMNVQGQAAALTGGYGNSYAAQAGSQAQQEYLTALSNKIPELERLAYGKYKDEETSQRNNLSALAGLDDTAYGRYQDDVTQYETKLADAYKKYRATLGGNRTQQQFYKDSQELWTIGNSGGDINQYMAGKIATGEWSPEYANYIGSTYQETFKKTDETSQASEEDKIYSEMYK